MNKNIVLTIVIIFIVIAIIAFLNRPKNNSSSPVIRKESSSEIGQKVSEFTLEDFDGQKIKLSQFAGSPIFIDFWAAWCPFCVEEMVEIETIHKEFGNKLIVLGIHRSETESIDKGAQFAKERGVTYTLLKDSTGEVYKTLTGGRNFMPYALYIDRTGKIVSFKAGPKTAKEMSKEVEKLLK